MLSINPRTCVALNQLSYCLLLGLSFSLSCLGNFCWYYHEFIITLAILDCIILAAITFYLTFPDYSSEMFFIKFINVMFYLTFADYSNEKSFIKFINQCKV